MMLCGRFRGVCVRGIGRGGIREGGRDGGVSRRKVEGWMMDG